MENVLSLLLTVHHFKMDVQNITVLNQLENVQQLILLLVHQFHVLGELGELGNHALSLVEPELKSKREQLIKQLQMEELLVLDLIQILKHVTWDAVLFLVMFQHGLLGLDVQMDNVIVERKQEPEQSMLNQLVGELLALLQLISLKP